MVVLLSVADNPLKELFDVSIETVVSETDVFYRDEVDVLVLNQLECLVEVARTECLALACLHTEGQQHEVAAECA